MSRRMLTKTTIALGWLRDCLSARVMATTMLSICCLAAGCSSNDVRHTISSEFADNSGRFDGAWKAHMLETPTPQVVQRWRINCQSFDQSIPINVSGGRVETRINDELHSAYLSRSGRFRLEIPTGLRMASSLSSGESLTDGRVTLILQGDLLREPRRGRFTFGIAEFANAGCSTRVNYERAEEEEV